MMGLNPNRFTREFQVRVESWEFYNTKEFSHSPKDSNAVEVETELFFKVLQNKKASISFEMRKIIDIFIAFSVRIDQFLLQSSQARWWA